MSNEPKYWFPAKRYGWGWGLPQTWQGWLVPGVFLFLLAVSRFIFNPQQEPVAFVIYLIAVSVLFGLLCWLKGEPPRWRWGDK